MICRPVVALVTPLSDLVPKFPQDEIKTENGQPSITTGPMATLFDAP